MISISTYGFCILCFNEEGLSNSRIIKVFLYFCYTFNTIFMHRFYFICNYFFMIWQEQLYYCNFLNIYLIFTKAFIGYFMIFPLTWTHKLYYVINRGRLLEEVMKRTWLPVDPWAGPSQSGLLATVHSYRVPWHAHSATTPKVGAVLEDTALRGQCVDVDTIWTEYRTDPSEELCIEFRSLVGSVEVCSLWATHASCVSPLAC